MAEIGTIYKGKVTNRSWAELPEEIVRMIATDYLFMMSRTTYIPEQWEARLFWYNRVVYTAIRDAKTMDMLMNICPQWTVALETHTFWNHVTHILDPQDIFVRRHHGTTQQNPYNLYRHIAYHSCLICRINSPQNSKGVLLADRLINTFHLGNCGICRDHRSHRTAFCGLCLREGQPYELEAGIDRALAVFCMANEDDEIWPGVDATCRACRSEWLWKTASQQAKHKDAVGGRRFHIQDWEARTAVECFLDLGESTIQEVIALCLEKFWLQTHTRLPDMMSQALAATRFAHAENEEEMEMELNSEIDEEDEDDMELLQLTEEGGVKDLALGDWARHRILDGHWLSPADQWYGNKSYSVRAIHPCPWAIETGHEHNAENVVTEEEDHPSRTILREDIPPTFPLCELAYHAHRKQLRLVLLPAMKNFVRKIVIECAEDGCDPVMRASRMSMEDVMRELRDASMWLDGVDWLERRRNTRPDESSRTRYDGSDDHASSTDSSSGKSSSDESNITSPVLSTSTFQTTPSPPPLTEGKDHAKRDESLARRVRRPVTIAVAPVLDPPRLIHPIPYVPITASHLPVYSTDTLKQIWREACSPLYHCRCKLCERAQANQAAQAGAGANQRANANNGRTPPAQDHNQTRTAPPTQIQLHEVIDVDAEEEEEVAYERSNEAEYDDEEDISDLSDVLSDLDDDDDALSSARKRHYALNRKRVSRSRTHSPEVPPAQLTAHTLKQPYRTPSPSIRNDFDASPSRPRKRSCDDVDSGLNTSFPLDLSQYHHGEPGTPPKRPRRDGPVMSLPVPKISHQLRPSTLSPGKMKKRGSQEMDGADYVSKRLKVSEDREEESGSGDSPPPRSTTSTSVGAEESEDDNTIRVVGATGIGVTADAIPRGTASSKGGGIATPPVELTKRTITPLPGRG
ncbi:hypothetical protein E1B28_010496 [Marasmius oreades]|uniref:Uncharacterized protein n=1 Tax=Marasmius oreades TaxID=181124 RepID=A0A9P7RXW6_9AGAR|nr:uncharacterized protein E1B28_010496 [Marasmius oreades]KAG7091465.1 hypothetical protein E1B28_010496 [Marasmius oreades]